MNDVKINPTCQELVSSDTWHFRHCGKPAKYSVNIIHGGGDKSSEFLCGIHARRWLKHRPERVTKLSKGVTK